MLDFNTQKQPKGPDTTPTKIDTVSVVGQFFRFQEVLAGLADQVTAIEVTDDDTLAQASEMANQARKIKNQIVKRLKAVTKQYTDAKKEVEGRVKSLLLFKFEELEQKADGKCRPYLLKKEEERIKAEREAEARARKEREEADAAAKAKAAAGNINDDPADSATKPTPPAFIIPEIIDEKTEVKTESGTAGIEYEYVVTLDDPRAISDECIKARWKYLESALLPYARARVKMGDRSIPGFTIKKEAKIKRRVH